MMITILVILSLTLTNALESQPHNSAEVKSIISKYFAKVPDIESRYVLNNGLSKSIWRYFKGKVQPFPLFKIQLKIDRNPVKIPWELADNNKKAKIKDGKRYRIMRIKSKRRRSTTPAETNPAASRTEVSAGTTTQASVDTTKADVSTLDSSTVDISTTGSILTGIMEASSTDAPASQPSTMDQPNNVSSSARR